MNQISLTFFIASLIVFLIIILLVQFIWNALMPDLFGTKQITLWQTVGILVLTNILFGGHCNATNISYY